MTIIGRRGGKSVYIPNSRNTMANRAAKQLEAHARAQGEKYSNALQVDAPMFYFWHNQGGSIPCSCTSKRRFSYPQPINPGEKESDFVGEMLLVFFSVGNDLRNIRQRFCFLLFP